MKLMNDDDDGISDEQIPIKLKLTITKMNLFVILEGPLNKYKVQLIVLIQD